MDNEIISETTHKLLCAERGYLYKCLPFAVEHSKHGRERVTIKLRKNFAEIYVKIRNVHVVEPIVSRQIPYYIYKKSCWVSRADLKNAVNEIFEEMALRKETDLLQKKKDEQLAEYLAVYASVPAPYKLICKVRYGKVKEMHLIKPHDVFCFKKYHGKSVEELLASEEFKEDFFTRLPEFLKLFEKIFGIS